MNMNRLQPSFPVICCLLFASCSLIDFSDACTYYGQVEIRPDWSGLETAETKPALTDVCLFSACGQSLVYRIAVDTLVKDVPAAKYAVLAFNACDVEHITFPGLDCPLTAGAELATFTEGGKRYTVQAPDFYAASTGMTVAAFETTVCRPQLQQAIRHIDIDFVMVGDTGAGINTLSGELSGIAYRYGLSTLEQWESSAWLAFAAARNGDTGNGNLLAAHLRVFGVNPDKGGTDRIDNLLDVVLETASGQLFTGGIDLTDILSGFTSRRIHITIEIRLGVMGIDVAVTGWKVSDGGSIEI